MTDGEIFSMVFLATFFGWGIIARRGQRRAMSWTEGSTIGFLGLLFGAAAGLAAIGVYYLIVWLLGYVS